MRYDVAVVGAGVAGLSCASALQAAGLHVTVLEAGHRLGGRVRSVRPVPGEEPVELGAQVVHGDRSTCWTFLGPAEKAQSFASDAEFRVRFAGKLRPAMTLARSGIAPWIIEQQITETSAEPTTAAAVLRSSVGPAGLTLGSEWLRQTWAADPEELDVAALEAARRDDSSGVGQYVAPGGFGTLVEQLSDGLDIRTDAPATDISCSGALVRVTGPEADVRARAAVVAIPPPVLAGGACTISPWTAEKRTAANALRLGDAVCVAMTMSDVSPGAFFTFDADGPGGFWYSATRSSTVVGVVKGPTAVHLRGLLAHPQELTALVAQLLPWTARCRPVGMLCADWGADPHITGAFTYPGPDFDRHAAAWRTPLDGRIFFAGEATCPVESARSVPGAIESGWRAAAEVREVLT